MDTLLYFTISIGFGALFLTAAWHKLNSFAEFKVILEEYQLLPKLLVGPAAIAIPLLEIALGMLWLSQFSWPLVSIASALLLTLYCIAIGINLLRGRIHISCGCVLGEEQPLTYWLILRNSVLILVSLACLLPPTVRELVWLDYVTVTLAVLATLLLYGATSQLFNNGAAIGSWRNHSD